MITLIIINFNAFIFLHNTIHYINSSESSLRAAPLVSIYYCVMSVLTLEHFLGEVLSILSHYGVETGFCHPILSLCEFIQVFLHFCVTFFFVSIFFLPFIFTLNYTSFTFLFINVFIQKSLCFGINFNLQMQKTSK